VTDSGSLVLVAYSGEWRAAVTRPVAWVAVLAPLLPNSVALGYFSAHLFPFLEMGPTTVLLGLEEGQMVEPIVSP